MSRSKNFIVPSLIASLLFHLQAFAAPEPELTYPELLVTPRASERLEMEAKRESANPWTRFIPLQISAMTTFTAGLIHQGDPATVLVGGFKNTNAQTAGLIAGGGWLVTTLALSAFYRPYTAAQDESSGLPRKTPREQLTRERLAEESLESMGQLMCRLNWLSFATHAGVAGLMAAKADRDLDRIVLPGMVLAAAFTPIVFTSRMQRVSREQRTYKKRIYGPVASLTPGMLSFAPGRIAPGLAFTLSF